MKCPGNNSPLAAMMAVFWCLLQFSTDTSLGQSGPPPIPPTPSLNHLLDFWPLEQTNWADVYGLPTRGFTNLNAAPSWDYAGTAVSVDTNQPAFLNYNTSQDGWTNIFFDNGSFSLWFQPNWTSVADGGTGPTNWAVLLSVGNWTSNASASAWTLAISPDGTNLLMEAQAAGSNQVVFNVPVDFDSGDWHNVAVTYTPTNCSLYLEGQPVTNTGPILYQPDEAACSNYGMFVGSLSTNGVSQFHGQLQWLATYEAPLSSNQIADDYANVSSYIAWFGGSLPSGGFHSDLDGPPDPGGGGTNTYDGPWSPPYVPQPDFTTNLGVLISNGPDNTIILTLTNAVPWQPCIILEATNLLGPWTTNQTFMPTNINGVAASIPIGTNECEFFKPIQIAPGQLRWAVRLTETNIALADVFGAGLDSAPALSPDGQTVYMTTPNTNIFAIDLTTGAVLWKDTIFTPNAASPQQAEFTGSPAVSSSNIFVGGIDGNLYSLNPTNGNTNWIRSVGDFAAIYTTPALDRSNNIYVATDESEVARGHDPVTGLICFKPDGTTNWFFQPQDLHDDPNNPDPSTYNQGDVDSSVAVADDGTVYFLAESWRLYALDADGNLKWELPMQGDTEPDSSVAIDSQGRIVVGSNSGYVYCINPDGSPAWVFNIGIEDDNGPIPCSPAIGLGDAIFFGSGSNDVASHNFYSLNSVGGTNWIFEPGTFNPGGGLQGLLSSPALGVTTNGGTASYFGCASGVFFALTNGNVQWAVTNSTVQPIISSPLIANDGSVIFGAEDGFLYCFWGSSLPATEAPWPTFHGNNQRTGLQPGTNTVVTTCGAPFLFGGTNNGAGHFTFGAAGNSASTWSVYWSSNLSTWTKFTTGITLTNPTDFSTSLATNVFTDTNVAGLTQRFYELSNNTCCSRVIGFVNLNIAVLSNLVANQLVQVDDGPMRVEFGPFGPGLPMNTLNGLFDLYPWATNMAQNELFKWNGTAFVEELDESGGPPFWPSGGDMTLLPGGSVFLVNTNGNPFSNSSPYTLTFTGLVRPQQVIQTQPGTNFLSATAPIAGAITNITGYIPSVGDVIKQWNTGSQAFVSHTYTSPGTWSGGVPTLNVGEGFVLVSTNSYTWTNTWTTSVCGGP